MNGNDEIICKICDEIPEGILEEVSEKVPEKNSKRNSQKNLRRKLWDFLKNCWNNIFLLQKLLKTSLNDLQAGAFSKKKKLIE